MFTLTVLAYFKVSLTKLQKQLFIPCSSYLFQVVECSSADHTVKFINYDQRSKVFFATRSFDGYNFTALADNKENAVIGSPVVRPLIVKGISRYQGLQNKQLPVDTLSSPGNTPDSQKKKIGT